MEYWQVSAGSDERDYSKEFIDYGLAFVEGEEIKNIKEGDRVILKKGNKEVRAVGVAVSRKGKVTGSGDKEWLKDFDGWILPNYCNILWHELDTPRPIKGLTRSRLCRVNRDNIKSESEKIIKEFQCKELIKTEPKETKKIEDKEMLEFLVSEGLRPSIAESLKSTLGRIRLLARYYYEREKFSWDDIGEHETRTFLIIPFLLGLGWSEQQIKIELGKKRGRIDVACFSKPFQRSKDEKRKMGKANLDDCMLIIESKGFPKGLDLAHNQAKNYAKNFKNCNVVVASNGYCYRAFKREKTGEFSQQPHSYLNILCLRDRYPRDPENVAGALGLLKLLLP